jgi:hypothetical protein
MSVAAEEVTRLVRGAEALFSEGDGHASRVAAWIAFAIATTYRAQLDGESRVRLARTAGGAGEMGDHSLAVLATKVVDPVLQDAAGGDLDVDIGELEELNFLRQRLNVYVGQHPVPLS